MNLHYQQCEETTGLTPSKMSMYCVAEITTDGSSHNQYCLWCNEVDHDVFYNMEVVERLHSHDGHHINIKCYEINYRCHTVSSGIGPGIIVYSYCFVFVFNNISPTPDP